MRVDRYRVRSLAPASLALALAALRPTSAAAIDDGLPVETCGFPSVVMLHGQRSDELCSASYIGGRVLITAGHCFDGRGFVLDQHLFSVRTGAALGDCEVDQDCPTLTIAGTPTQLACSINSDHGICHLPDPEYNNQYLEAWFAESYQPYGVGQPDVSAAILPCHNEDGQWAPGPHCGGFPRSP